MATIQKLFQVIFLIILTSNYCPGQESHKAITELDSYILKITDAETEKIQLPFSNIQVIDLRFDTTKIGFIKDKAKFKKLVTPGKFDTVIQRKLNNRYRNHFDVASKRTLIIFIRHFWVHQTTDAEEANQKLVINDPLGYRFAELKTLIECFIKIDNGHIPLVRIDSSFTRNFSIKKDDECALFPFDNLIKKITSLNFEKIITSRKSLNNEELKNYYATRFNLPRLTNDITEKGIYLTFKDFLNNHLTKKEFKVQFGDLTDELFINENGKEIFTDNFWGFSNGKKKYIKIGYNFYELEKQENGYEIWGSKLTKHNNRQYDLRQRGGPGATLPDYMASAIIGIASQANRTFNERRPFQLNMETGFLY